MLGFNFNLAVLDLGASLAKGVNQLFIFFKVICHQSHSFAPGWSALSRIIDFLSIGKFEYTELSSYKQTKKNYMKGI